MPQYLSVCSNVFSRGFGGNGVIFSASSSEWHAGPRRGEAAGRASIRDTQGSSSAYLKVLPPPPSLFPVLKNPHPQLCWRGPGPFPSATTSLPHFCHPPVPHPRPRKLEHLDLKLQCKEKNFGPIITYKYFFRNFP